MSIARGGEGNYLLAHATEVETIAYCESQNSGFSGGRQQAPIRTAQTEVAEGRLIGLPARPTRMAIGIRTVSFPLVVKDAEERLKRRINLVWRVAEAIRKPQWKMSTRILVERQ